MSNEELVLLIQQGINTTENITLLYEQTKKFISKTAKKYTPYADLEDLEQEGYLGLYEAIYKYDPDQGNKFLTYASHWISQTINRYLENNGSIVRIPSHYYRRMNQYTVLVKKFPLAYNREPTEREICVYMDLSMQQVHKLKKDIRMRQISSIDKLVSDSENLTLGDTIADTNDLESSVVDELADKQLKELLWSEVDSLPGDTSEVMRKRYINNMTLAAVGETMGVTRERIRQIEAKGLRKLRCRRNFIQRVKEFDVIQTRAYSGGVSSFNRTWTSSTEYVAMKLLEM